MAEQNSQTPGWIWLLSGLVIGLFIAFLVFVKNKNETLMATDNNSQPVQASIGQAPPKDNDTAPTTFEFYKLLPKDDGGPPATDRAPPAVKKAPVTVAAPKPPDAPKSMAEPGNYLLQIGSFRRYEDADTLKAKLAFSGIVANIESVQLANGQEWHRVRIGPSRDMQFINSTQKQLRANEFSAMLMKAPNQ